MAYSSWSVVFGEQPSAAKWNILGTNDAHFYTYAGEGTNAIQQIARTNYNAVATGTTQIPNDDTIPQITEGTEFMTLSITPKSATNLLVFRVNAWLTNSTADRWLNMALFQDATADALAATTFYAATGSGSVQNYLSHSMTAGTTSSTTFRIRAGSNGSGTVTFNGVTGGRLFGAVTHSSIEVTEYKV